MRILLRQFLGKRHSWCCCGWGLASAFKQLGHQVDLFSTDGIKYVPADLKENLIGHTEENRHQVFGKIPENNYEACLSYTALKNMSGYLAHAPKNRFGIFVYEWAGKNVLPAGFAKHYKSCDKLCVPSNFGKQVFADSGIPEQAMVVIPHGINASDYRQTNTIKLPTQRRFKILANLAQLHRRKNIPGLLDAYGKAFTDKDDVCLIIKAKDKPITMQFEVSLKDCLKDFYTSYPKHAEVKVFPEFVEDMSSLYRSVDATYTLAHCEGFYFPGLESMAAGKINIAPGWGGQLDFLSDSNSLLVEGKEARADPRSMYWESKPNAVWFQPSVDNAADKLRYAYHNFEKLNERLDKQRPDVYAKYDWQVIAKQFLELCR